MVYPTAGAGTDVCRAWRTRKGFSGEEQGTYMIGCALSLDRAPDPSRIRDEVVGGARERTPRRSPARWEPTHVSDQPLHPVFHIDDRSVTELRSRARDVGDRLLD